MAELIDISKKAVEALVNKINSAIKEEEEQWQSVERDLVFITDELETMQSFLSSADGELIVKTNVVRTWVTQVRNLSYDLEDCIEFILHLDAKKRSWWLRLVPSWPCSCGKEGVALPVDEAVTEMKKLKARVEDVSQRNIRYRFVSDCASLVLTQQPVVHGPAIGAPRFDILAEARDTAARRTVDLVRLINEKSNDLRVISLWATGDDLGTVPIIRNMYDDSTIKAKFGCRAWVKVVHPMNPHEFVRSLVVQFYANSCQQLGGRDALSRLFLKYKKQRDALSWMETSAGDLLKEFLWQVDTHRYLIILEDLSSVVQWDAIRPYLRESSNGSRVLVSTRHHEIASLCTGKPYQVSELQRISANQSICIYFKPGSVPAKGGFIMDGSVPEHNRLVGRSLEAEKLFSLINNRPRNNKPHVISMWGIPGSGRTSLAINVRYHWYKMQLNSRRAVTPTVDTWDRTSTTGTMLPKIHVEFNRQATVNMPQPYNLVGFCRCLLSELSLQPENPIQQCCEVLHKDRCLVVIDEVQSKEDWDSIKDAGLISATSESCIIVITTEESVAVHCAGADDLVCSIRCLQSEAAFDLFQQVFHEKAFPNNRNPFEEQRFRRNIGSFGEQAFNSIFGMTELDKQAFQKYGFEEQGYQNDGNSFNEQLFQNNGNSVEEQIYENNGNSFEEQTLQKNRNYFEGESSHNTGNSPNHGTLFEEQALQNNETMFEEQVFHNNRKSFEERAFKNYENSSEGQAFGWLFETNKEEEHAFENNGGSFEEDAFENRRGSFQENVFQNSENLFEEEQSYQNSESSFEELEPLRHRRNLLEEVPDEVKFQNIEDSMSQDNIKAILSMSGGFPQVIVALARSLANIAIRDRAFQCQRLTDNFMKELQTGQEFYCLRSLFAWIRSYFRSCSASLMRSMLYLLIFPRGKAFRRRRLVRRWIAEGYAEGSESNSLEEMGKLFHRLASQSVIQETTADAACYEVNGFFHEYMISRPMEDRILSPLEVSVLDGYCSRLASKGVGQHLAIWSSWDRNRIVFDSLDLLRLRSLTVFGRMEPFFISDRTRVLRVLDLEDAENVTNADVENIGKVLRRLKFLSLRGLKDINCLPYSFGGLSHLQTLDIRGTSVVKLPTSITKLKKLQYVRAGTPAPPDDDASSAVEEASAPSMTTMSSRPHAATPVSRFLWLPESWSWTRHCHRFAAAAGSRPINGGGVVVPGGIGKMTTLHTLGIIDVSVARGRAILEELKNLTQLRKLGVSGINRTNCHELCFAISGLTHLESLSVQLDKENNQGCLDAISRPPENVRSLKLYGYADTKLPVWIKDLRKLSKFKLQITRLPSDELDILNSIPELHNLSLHFSEFEDGELQFRSGFNSLVILEIACRPRLRAVTFHSGVMPSLECLILRCCGNVSSLMFSGLEQLGGIKEVRLSGSYEEAFKQQLHSQINKHPKENKPVLKVESPCA